ncbi:MAG: hypothetical protein OER22_13785 [Gammaproteobacteria bacterium]|nr:hypothetical protein [Gammaproteobacteria bacterium]MDH3375074.1 hypothetical protein [Gammaproteobacteria bacterium]MDH3553684.1 hypothetical protein [Gammaproteobacteria bacterium]
MEIVADFNQWGENYGYKTTIAVPFQNENLASMYWLGPSANTAAFGKDWDAWRDAQRDAQRDANSRPANFQARISECGDSITRHGYDIY